MSENYVHFLNMEAPFCTKSINFPKLLLFLIQKLWRGMAFERHFLGAIVNDLICILSLKMIVHASMVRFLKCVQSHLSKNSVQSQMGYPFLGQSKYTYLYCWRNFDDAIFSLHLYT